jgi:hypothetical protein
MSSRFCAFGRRLDIIPWTPYLEECCRILGAPGSSREDKSAVMLARVQMVAQRIGQNPWEGRQDFTGSAPPPLLYLKSLQNQIQQLKGQMDPILEEESKSSCSAYPCGAKDLIINKSNRSLDPSQR